MEDLKTRGGKSFNDQNTWNGIPTDPFLFLCSREDAVPMAMRRLKSAASAFGCQTAGLR